MAYMEWSLEQLGPHAVWVAHGYMAHPNDERLRNMHHAYVMARMLAAGVEYPAPFDSGFWEVMAAATERGMGNDLQAATAGGCIAGDVLLTVLEMRHNHMPDGGIEKACFCVSALYSRHFSTVGGKHFDASLANVRRLWRTFRPVAHLWAAYLILWRELEARYRGTPEWEASKILVLANRHMEQDGLFNDPRFLPTAEALYRQAAALRLPRSRQYLLDDSAWRMKGVEPARLIAPPITDKMRAILDSYAPRER